SLGRALSRAPKPNFLAGRLVARFLSNRLLLCRIWKGRNASRTTSRFTSSPFRREWVVSVLTLSVFFGVFLPLARRTPLVTTCSRSMPFFFLWHAFPLTGR